MGQYGFIAEEVAEVLPDLTVFNKDGQPETVKYHLLPTFLLAAYQRDHETVGAQADELAREQQAIKAQQQREIEALERAVRRIEATLAGLRAASLTR